MSDFDVVIPCKGNLQYIDFTLKSIAKSSLLPQTVIIVDDGIVNKIKCKYPNLNIAIIKNAGNGLVDALNTGFKCSTQNYVARIDSDDMVTPQRFEKQVQILKHKNDIGVVGSQLRFINEEGALGGISKYPNYEINNNKLFNKLCLIAHPSTMISKEAFDESGGYRRLVCYKKTDLGEDFDLWLRISKTHILYNLDTELTFYRQHTEQLSSQNLNQQLIATVIISAINKNPNELLKFKLPVNLDDNLNVDPEIENLISKNIGHLSKLLIVLYRKNSHNGIGIKKIIISFALKIVNFIYRKIPG